MECFICFEKEDVSQLEDIRYLYWTTCVCNATIHESCFEEWFILQPKCPLCRKQYFSKLSACKNVFTHFQNVCYKCYITYLYIVLVFVVLSISRQIILDLY